MAFGKRLKQARRLEEMSQEELGAIANVTKQAISKYELGKDMPGSSVISKLAEALKVEEEYFFRQVPEVEIGKPLYRKGHKIASKDKKRLMAGIHEWFERYLEAEMLYEAVQDPIFAQPRGFPYQVSQPEDVEKAAIKLREIWKLGLDPIGDVIALLEDKGLKIRLLNNEYDFEALTVPAGDHTLIAVSSNVPGDRQRFSLMHELGHIILELPKQTKVEQTIDRFAAAFLVPEKIAKEELGDKRKNLYIEELYLLKLKYGMSMNAWLRRAKDLSIITENYFCKTKKDFENKGWNIREPFEPYPQEKPNRMKQLIYRAFAENLISESKAIDLIGEPYQMTAFSGVALGQE